MITRHHMMQILSKSIRAFQSGGRWSSAAGMTLIIWRNAKGLFAWRTMSRRALRISESEVTQSCPTLCDPMDCSLLGSSTMGFSRQEHWSELLVPSPGDPPDPGIKPGSPSGPLQSPGRLFTIWATREAPVINGVKTALPLSVGIRTEF